MIDFLIAAGIVGLGALLVITILEWFGLWG